MSIEPTTYYWKRVGVRFHLIAGSTTVIFKHFHDLEQYCAARNITPIES